MTDEKWIRSPQESKTGSPASAGPAGKIIEDALAIIESNLVVVSGNPGRVEEACLTLRRTLPLCPAPRAVGLCLQRLVPLLKAKLGPLARILFLFLEQQSLEADDPRPLVHGLLETRDPGLRVRAVELLLNLAEGDRLTPDIHLVISLAHLIEEGEGALHEPATLSRIGNLLQHLPPAEVPHCVQDPVEALFLAGSPPLLRWLAARVLDQEGEPVPSARCERLLGKEACSFLSPYLAYTRATHRDLVDLTPTPDAPPPAVGSMAHAEELLGRQLLETVIGQLGWSRLAWGLSVERLIGLSIGGSFPFVLAPPEAELLESCGPSQRLWERYLIITHGGTPKGGDLDGSEVMIQRFRRYNLVHAEALEEILEIAPLTPHKVRRVLDRMTVIVDDFIALFSEHTDEAARLPALYNKIQTTILESIEGMDDDSPLSAEATRLVNMFEDPRSLDEIRTMHGLKRYLHQQGLRYAFRLFRSSRTTNRTVDLILTDSQHVLHIARPIRYLDFEPDRGAGPLDLPFPVALAANALGRQIVHSRQTLPALEILRYGNEVQVYINFRNHPAFLRLDLSPPLRGGMIDLEYFGVSQYEMDHHPDLSLISIQRLIQRLEFDVEQAGIRLHVRYDKERAFDLDDLTDKAIALFRLLPYLMEVDWVIGGLDYSKSVRNVVGDAWAEFFLRWGVLPMEQFLTKDRRRILSGVSRGPAGEHEIPWNGRGAYEDRFSGTPPEDLPDRLQKVLEERGLEMLASWVKEGGLQPAQVPLERAVLEPLRNGSARGEVLEAPEGLEPAPEELFLREHEAERLAEILEESGEPLARAVRLAGLVTSIQRQVRFRTTGSIQGYPVQRAILPLRGERVGLFTLCDENGTARLAFAAVGEVLFRSRPDCHSAWTRCGDVDFEELIRYLRRDNYLGEGFEAAGGEPVLDTAELAARFRSPNKRAQHAPKPDERIVPGVTASPGRATGFARFGTSHLMADELLGAVLLAPVIRPEDAPLLRHSSGIVSTGGGILSHVGLIALELKKPALIIAGRWLQDRRGATVLVYRRPEILEEESTRGAFRIVRRRELRDREETLKEGDLVVVDADASSLVILGQDRDALALHHELHQMKEASERLASAEKAPEVLVFRGRLLRAIHQLQKLLARIDHPPLARHAARELLLVGDASHTMKGPVGRRGLLRTLFDNAACGGAARETAAQRLGELVRRHEASSREILQAIPSLTNLFEILYLRLDLLHTRDMLREVTRLLVDCGLDAGPFEEGPEVDTPSCARLEAFRQELGDALLEASRSTDEGWRSRHLLKRLERLAGVLGTPRHDRDPCFLKEQNDLHAERDRSCASDLAGRRILSSRDGGIELRLLIGPKAANLGEMARVLGGERVPEWFAVTDRAFREILEHPVGVRTMEKLGIEITSSPTLGRTIEEVLAREDWDAARKTVVIRQLWLNARLPGPFEEEVLRAYRSLGGNTSGSPAPEQNQDEPFVAIRSSAFEEDTESSAWAGQFDTFLFIRGKRALIDHLKLAWAGLWSERALDHRRMLGASYFGAGGGVIIQRIVRARVSGVLHTVCAATGHLREMVVNVGLGLGEGVVSGTVDVDQVHISKKGGPDEDPLRFRYRVGDKREQVVFDARVGLGTRREETLYHQRLRPALEYVELKDLVQTSARLERVYGQPLDIEFAIEDSTLYFLQARPIGVFHAAWQETIDKHPLAKSPAREHEERRS